LVLAFKIASSPADIGTEANIANELQLLNHSAIIARPLAAVRMMTVSSAASVVPAASHVIVGTVSRFIVAVNALLVRNDELHLEQALVTYNADVIRLRAAAAAAAASEPPTAGEPESKGKEEKPQLPKPVDVAAMMAQYSQFDSATRAGAASAKSLAAKASQQQLIVDGTPAAHISVQPDGLTVHEFVNTLDAVTPSAFGTVLWHYVASPSANIVQKQLIFAAKQAVGTGLGTLLLPGKGSTVLRLIGELL
jgi:hypothetical protein